MNKIIAFTFLLMSGYVSGQQVKNFALINVHTNQTVSLSDFASSPGIILIFTSNECAFDEHYYGRIKEITRQDKLPVILVNSHRGENEGAAAMKSKAVALGLSVPYLTDKEQSLMSALKVTKSPEAVVLKNTGGNFSVFYQGNIDDNPQVERDVKVSYVKDALSALLNGKPAPESTRPVGCFIRR